MEHGWRVGHVRGCGKKEEWRMEVGGVRNKSLDAQVGIHPTSSRKPTRASIVHDHKAIDPIWNRR